MSTTSHPQPNAQNDMTSSTNESSSDRGTFTYSALTTPTSIRMVSLARLDWKDDDNPELLLKHVDLASKPVYDALSYTWGAPITIFPSSDERDKGWDNTDRLVLCNNQILYVTANLWHFLQSWRKRLSKQTTSSTPLNDMWIDAICINQADVDERSAQVSLMGSIYSQCRQVNIWLGPEDVFSGPALSRIVRIAMIPKEQWESTRKAKDTDGKLKILGLPPARSKTWCSLYAFLFRTWFSRIWVVQELALAPVAQLICGSSSLRWITFASGLSRMERHGMTHDIMSAAWHRLQVMDKDFSPFLCRTDSPTMFVTTDRIDPNPHNSVLFLAVLACIANGEVETPDAPLWQITTWCRHLHATDPRDKVYGVLELYERKFRPADNRLLAQSVVVNYRSTTTAQVYLDLAWNALLETKNLDILPAASTASNLEGLPSWAPDWSVPIGSVFILEEQEPRSSSSIKISSNSWNPPAEEKMFGTVLPVEGALIDDISESVSRNSSSVLESVLGAATVACKLAPEYPWSVDRQPPFEVLWRTLISDEIGGECPAPKDYDMVFKQLWIWVLQTVWEMQFYGAVDAHEEVWSSLSKVHFHFFPEDETISAGGYREGESSTAGIVRHIMESKAKLAFDKSCHCTESHEHREHMTETRSKGVMAEAEDQLKQALDSRSTDESIGSHQHEQLVDRLTATRRLKVFRTKLGIFGMGSREPASGDQVWYLVGSTQLAILRPKENGRFTFIGLCYVHGSVDRVKSEASMASVSTIELE